jgi:branched-subunit amino acid transport protein
MTQHVELQNWSLWAALFFACIGTYFCRSIGVLLSGRVDQNSEFFIWLTCVTYAMVAALTARLVLLPQGLLATVPLFVRITVCVITLAVMTYGGKRRLGPALSVGILILLAYVQIFSD